MAQSTLEPVPDMRLSLGDVALLAKVRRPVVSTWRRRARASGDPFPAPVTTVHGQELFDAAEVLTWLDACGRGTNPEARSDVAAFAALAEAPLQDDATFDGVTALLCLRTTVDHLPPTAAELVDLADEVDPDDEFLLREVQALGVRSEALSRYVDLCVSAAYHPAGALDRVVAAWSRGRIQASAPPLGDDAQRLVADVALALAGGAEGAAPVVVDPTGGGDLLRAVVEQSGEAGGCSVAVPSATSPARRRVLRQMHVRGVHRILLRGDGASGWDLPEGSVVLLQVPATGAAEMTELEVLRHVEDVVLEVLPDHPVLVVGPASALTDRLSVQRDQPGRPPRDAARRSEASRVRDDVLRSGRVRAVVRLPAGLVPARPRRRTALWCLGPAPEGSRGGGGADQLRTMVGDLSNEPLGSAASASLVTDIAAAAAGGRVWAAHAAQHLRPVLTRELLTRDDLVPPALERHRPAPAVTVLEEVESLTAVLRRQPPAVVVPGAQVREVPAEQVSTTIGEALRLRHLRVQPGAQIEAEDLHAAGGLRVLGVEELVGDAAPAQRIDQLVLEHRYPGVERTEPGDVIFATTPRPLAVVDSEGGSVVTAPARVLRCSAPQFVPAVLAADINAQDAWARTWRAWRVRLVPPDQGAALSAALDDVSRHRALLSERLGALDRLSAALVLGATSGALDLTN